MTTVDPKPPLHPEEKFPKTMTFPEGWNTDNITAGQSSAQAASSSDTQAYGNTRPDALVRPVGPDSNGDPSTRHFDTFPPTKHSPELNGWGSSKM